MAEVHLRLSESLANRVARALQLHEPRVYEEFYPYVRSENNRIARQKMEREQEERRQKRLEKERSKEE